MESCNSKRFQVLYTWEKGDDRKEIEEKNEIERVECCMQVVKN